MRDTLMAHFCPGCGRQCGCDRAVLAEGTDEAPRPVVEDCTHCGGNP